MTTPSNLQIGDKAVLYFGHTQIKDCQIKEVHFSEGKVRYDVYVPYEGGHTLIENVDSVLVERTTDASKSEKVQELIYSEKI